MGAPLYMARRSDGQRSELGRLYLYLGRGQQRLAGPPQTLTGTHPYGRFAAAIASLGDLDKDGFGGNSAAGAGGTVFTLCRAWRKLRQKNAGGCSRPFCPQTWQWEPRRGVTVAAGRSSSSAGRARGWHRCPPSAWTAPSPAPPPSASRCVVPPTWTATATRVQPWHDTALAPPCQPCVTTALPALCHHPGTDPLLVPADLLVGAYGVAKVAVYQ